MGFLFRCLRNWFVRRKNQAHTRCSLAKEPFIQYKIIDSNNSKQHTIQCINSRTVFQANISEIVYNLTILYGLHPVQACGVGIELATALLNNEDVLPKKRRKLNLERYKQHRYGKYCLHYQDRKGKIFYVNCETDEGSFEDPRDIALNKALISEFDAGQAFYIGFEAGLKRFDNSDGQRNPSQRINDLPHYLRVVK